MNGIGFWAHISKQALKGNKILAWHTNFKYQHTYGTCKKEIEVILFFKLDWNHRPLNANSATIYPFNAEQINSTNASQVYLHHSS